MSDKIRLFVSADLPTKINDKLEDLVGIIRRHGPPIRFYNKYQFHLTLKFLGAVDLKSLKEIQQSLETSVSLLPPFKISLDKLGFASPARSGAAVWVETLGEPNTLEKLKRKIDDNLLKLGFKKDNRFKPHITIGRFQKAPYKQIKSAMEVLEELKKKELREDFEIKSISLMQSIPTPRGSIYNPIHNFPL